jgi:hypothetical protein
MSGNVIHATFGRDDGGKARIKRRRCAIGLDHMFHGSTVVDAETLGLAAPDVSRSHDVLTMDHADPEDTRPSELA